MISILTILLTIPSALAQPRWLVILRAPALRVSAASSGVCYLFGETIQGAVAPGRRHPLDWVGLPEQSRPGRAARVAYWINDGRHMTAKMSRRLPRRPKAALEDRGLRLVSEWCPPYLLDADEWHVRLQDAPRRGRQWILAYFAAALYETPDVLLDSVVVYARRECRRPARTECRTALGAYLDLQQAAYRRYEEIKAEGE